MATTYQTLGTYSGNLYGLPKYDGIEYDWEVPDNLVVASPGGVDSIHHHYTKGFNGRGNTSSDIYAGQGPRYIAGEFGSLYQTGQTAGQHMGYYQNAPDYKFWKNQQPQTTNNRENYVGQSDFDIISPPDSENTNSSNAVTINPIGIPSSGVLFLVFFLSFAVSMMWVYSGKTFVKQFYYKGKTPPWTMVALFTVCLTLFFSIVMYFLGMPLIKFN
jgi:hypothetical protein